MIVSDRENTINFPEIWFGNSEQRNRRLRRITGQPWKSNIRRIIQCRHVDSPLSVHAVDFSFSLWLWRPSWRQWFPRHVTSWRPLRVDLQTVTCSAVYIFLSFIQRLAPVYAPLRMLGAKPLALTRCSLWASVVLASILLNISFYCVILLHVALYCSMLPHDVSGCLAFLAIVSCFSRCFILLHVASCYLKFPASCIRCVKLLYIALRCLVLLLVA